MAATGENNRPSTGRNYWPLTPATTGRSRGAAAMFRQAAERFPHIIEIATVGAHDDTSVVGQGCGDQLEFEFALDVLLDGLERLHKSGWSSTDHGRGNNAAG